MFVLLVSSIIIIWSKESSIQCHFTKLLSNTSKKCHRIYSWTCFFRSVRLLVLRDHSGVFIPATTANDLRLRRISIQDFIHYIFCPIFILQKEPVFHFLMFSAKQWNYWYHFYNVFGMTRSLIGDWTQDLPHWKPYY